MSGLNFAQDYTLEKKLMSEIQKLGVIKNDFFKLCENKKLSYTKLGNFVTNFYEITDVFVNNLNNLIENIDNNNDDGNLFINKQGFRDTIEKIRKDEFAEFSKNPIPSEYHHNLLRRIAERLGLNENDKHKDILQQTHHISRYIEDSFQSDNLVKSLAIIFVIESMAATMFTVLKTQADSMKDDTISFFTLDEKKRIDLHYVLENEEHIGESHELLDVLSKQGKNQLERYISEFAQLVGEYWEAQAQAKFSILKRAKIELYLLLFGRRDVHIKVQPLPF